jgi:hypothetical protein
VVDSISNLFRDVDSGDNQELSERSRTLYVLARLLKEYAYTYDIVIVVTNHVRDLMDSETTSSVLAPSRAHPIDQPCLPYAPRLLHLLSAELTGAGIWIWAHAARAHRAGHVRQEGRPFAGPSVVLLCEHARVPRQDALAGGWPVSLVESTHRRVARCSSPTRTNRGMCRF